jgi:hypothetical protein
MKTPELVRLEERYQHLQMIRAGHEDMLLDAQKYVAPNKASFRGSMGLTSNREEDQSKTIYDSTPVWANQMFANGLSSYLIPKADRWAYLKPEGIPSAMLSDEELIFLEKLSDKVNHLYALPDCQFYSSSHEAFHDIGSFGTAVVYVNRDKPIINYKACPLADSFFDVDEEGKVDTMFFRKFLSNKALAQQFPDVVNVKGFDAFAQSKKYELVFSVEPNNDPAARKGGRLGKQRPYKVSYWVPELNAILKQTEKSYFPFIVPRWAVIAGEVWGRGPATTCMSQIRVLNKMVKELLKSAERANDPPLTAEDDSILLPITYGSGQVMFYEAGAAKPEPLVSGSQPNLTLEMLRDYREQITKAFFVDQIIREQKKERQSITEIQDERGQMLQQLGPLLARQEVEYLGPSIEHNIEFLQDKDPEFFRSAPESLAGQNLEIVYTSPAAHAQYAGAISNMSGFIQDITPLAQQDPTILENIDANNLFANYGRMRNIPRNVVKSKDAVNAAREQREEQEQMQMAAQAAPQMAGAMKDIASARETDPEGVGQLLSM